MNPQLRLAHATTIVIAKASMIDLVSIRFEPPRVVHSRRFGILIRAQVVNRQPWRRGLR
jgi:hypothetical protein